MTSSSSSSSSSSLSNFPASAVPPCGYGVQDQKSEQGAVQQSNLQKNQIPFLRELAVKSLFETFACEANGKGVEKPNCMKMYESICRLELEEQRLLLPTLTHTRRLLEQRILQEIHDDICKSIESYPITGASGQASRQICSLVSKGDKQFKELIFVICNLALQIVDDEQTGKCFSVPARSYCQRPDTVALLLRFASQKK